MGKGKSHVTKKELETRKKAEKPLLTQIKFKEKTEIKANPIAHKEFLHIKKLFVKIDKNDGLFENGVNRYCMMYAECSDFEVKREVFFNSINILEDEYDKNKIYYYQSRCH